MAAHPGLLRAFGSFQGRRSRVFHDAAIVGKKDFPRCALVTPQQYEDYVLVHLLSVAANHVDKIGPDAIRVYVEVELRFHSWEKLVECLHQLGEDIETLISLEQQSQAHLSWKQGYSAPALSLQW